MSIHDSQITPIAGRGTGKKSMPRRIPRWQRWLHRFFERVWVELIIGGLILISVVLTFADLIIAGPEGQPLPALESANRTLTWIFAVELSLRFLGFPKKLRFFREYWLDLISLLPLFRPFRAARAVRLLRLLRLLRLIGVVNRLSSHFPYAFRRGITEYLVVTGLLLLTVMFGAAAIRAFETRNVGFDTWDEAFWFSVYTLFAGEPVAGEPQTTTGKIVAVGIMFMGLTIFAMFTGTITAFMVDRLQREGRYVDFDHFEGHTVICGWSRKAEIVIREYRLAHAGDSQPVVVIAEFEDDDPPHLSLDLRPHVAFLDDDFTRVSALEQVGIHRAKTCILLSDSSGGRSDQDADARTILAALTVEKLNPDVYTCAEIHNRSYGAHLEMGRVNDFVVNGEHSAYLLAQAAINRGLMSLFGELLTQERGNQFYRRELPTAWVESSFWDVFCELKKSHNAILIAAHREDGSYLLNPDDYVFAAGDEIIFIADREPSLP